MTYQKMKPGFNAFRHRYHVNLSQMSFYFMITMNMQNLTKTYKNIFANESNVAIYKRKTIDGDRKYVIY